MIFGFFFLLSISWVSVIAHMFVILSITFDEEKEPFLVGRK
jgi:hypothetical protein